MTTYPNLRVAGIATFALAAFLQLSCVSPSVAQGVFSFDKPEAAPAEPQTRFEKILKLIADNYVDEVSDSALQEQALEALIAQLDPYSGLMSAAYSQRFENRLNDWQVNPLGLQMWTPEGASYPAIWSVRPGSPGGKLGILPGDELREVSGETLRNNNAAYANELMSATDDKMRIIVYRPADGKLHGYNVTPADLRDHKAPTGWMIDTKTAYLGLDNFNSYAAKDVLAELRRLNGLGMQQLVFDLRGNPGGLVDAALAVVSIFVDPDIELLRVVRRNEAPEIFHSRMSSEFRTLPLVLLVDSNSASASEIVAGVFQDLDRALIVGNPTYGKGTSMNLLAVGDGSKLYLATGRLVLPSGRSIQKGHRLGKMLPQPVIETVGYNLDHVGDAPARDSKFRPVLTFGGRKVFGGEGVIPDYILGRSSEHAYDAYLYSDRYYSLIWNYVTTAAPQIKAQGADGYIANFAVPSAMVDSLAAMIPSKSLACGPLAVGGYREESVSEVDRAEIALVFKGNMAYMFFGNSEWIKSVRTEDPVLKQAVSLFDVARQVAGL